MSAIKNQFPLRRPASIAGKCFPNPLLLVLCLGALALTGCTSTKSASKPPPEKLSARGWIGGQYKVVHSFPPELHHTQKAAMLITALSTNTPAYLAGLREGDLILEFNHRPATNLRTVRETIDRSEPGSVLPLQAWRDGQTADYDIRVGREKYSKVGTFAVGLPGFFHKLDLWPPSGLSFVVVGYRTEPVSHREELGSTEVTYLKNCDLKNYAPVDEGWRAWLVIMQAETSKRIKSQEIVAAP